MAYYPVFQPQPIGTVTVTTPGVPVPLCGTLLATTNAAAPSGYVLASLKDVVAVNKVLLAASPLTHDGEGNTGNIYIGQQDMDRATLYGVIAVIGPGQPWPFTNNVSFNIYQFQNWYMDADNAGDGCYGNIDQC